MPVHGIQFLPNTPKMCEIFAAEGQQKNVAISYVPFLARCVCMQ